LLIKHFLERSSRKLSIDPAFESVPIFFPDLSFGTSNQPQAFSIVHVSGQPIPFLRTGTNYKFPLGSGIEAQKTYLLAGADGGGNFTWMYARAQKIWTINDELSATFERFTSNADPEEGKLIAAEVHGFLWKDQTLYWVSPAGALQPYLSGLQSFEYSQQNGLLSVRWKVGQAEMEFRCVL
jgi:hypothetical protein